ncbi:uncharacterized protein [Argopecten irradians]|uniref:uncharacterized protein n=1 Tax=Argopecten irradians TaxID=31199 RepID=UPI00371344F5
MEIMDFDNRSVRALEVGQKRKSEEPLFADKEQTTKHQKLSVYVTESKTYTYLVSDNAEPKRGQRGRRSGQRRKRSNRTLVSTQGYNEHNVRPDLIVEVTETPQPVVTTLTPAAHRNKKLRKTKTWRKRKRGARHRTPELTSQTIKLGLTARERFREAQVNALTFRMNKITPCTSKVCIGQKRKFDEMDFDIDENVANNLILKFERLSI